MDCRIYVCIPSTRLETPYFCTQFRSSDETPFTVEVPSNASASQAHFYQSLNETSATNRLDFDYTFKETNAGAFEMKTGYWAEYKTRSFQARQIGHIAHDEFSDDIASLPYDQIFDPTHVDYQYVHVINENTKATSNT